MDHHHTVKPWHLHRCKLCRYNLHYIPRHVRQHKTRSKDHRFACGLHSPEKYKCGKCQFQSHFKTLVSKHFNAFHKTEEKEHYPVPVLLVCPRGCDFQTYSSLVLLNHDNRCDSSPHTTGKRKNTSFRCSYCSFKCTGKQCLKWHVLCTHTFSEQIKAKRDTPLDQINWYKCDHCSYKTKRKINLNSHMVNMHTPAKQVNWFKCEHCRYKTEVEFDLYRHVLRRHKEKNST